MLETQNQEALLAEIMPLPANMSQIVRFDNDTQAVCREGCHGQCTGVGAE